MLAVQLTVWETKKAGNEGDLVYSVTELLLPRDYQFLVWIVTI